MCQRGSRVSGQSLLTSFNNIIEVKYDPKPHHDSGTQPNPLKILVNKKACPDQNKFTMWKVVQINRKETRKFNLKKEIHKNTKGKYAVIYGI